MSTEKNLEIKEILKYYEIGDLVDCARNARGYVNTSYEIETSSEDGIHKYFLRRYKKGIKKEDLEFEHSLINHLVEKKLPWIARVIRTKDGKSYIHKIVDENDKEGAFIAIFDYLEGEDEFTWINPICCNEELISAAEILAQYHNAVYNFIPMGKRSEPGIIKLLTELTAIVSEAQRHTKNTIFDAYLIEKTEVILKNITETLTTVREPECMAEIQLPIHCDFHPGNLKFRQNRAIGLFDFDWSKIDLRAFDVGLALFYFFTSWGEQDGILRLKEMALFLNAYQNTLKNTSEIGPLRASELKYLPSMINAANLFVLNWTIRDYFQKDVDPQEYLVYLKHSVNLIHWMEQSDNQVGLINTIRSIQEGRLPLAHGKNLVENLSA